MALQEQLLIELVDNPEEIYDGMLKLVIMTRSRNNKIRHQANLPYLQSCFILARTGHEMITCQRNGRTISLIEPKAHYAHSFAN